MKNNETMREYFNAVKSHFREKREKRNEKLEPLLIKNGCIKKSDGVYEKGDWLLYPTKGFAMNKKKTNKRIPIKKFLDI